MTKYGIKQIPFPKYRGKHAELKATLDQMNHGDCIIMSNTELLQARVHNSTQNKQNKKQYRLVCRRHTNPKTFQVWKLEEGVDPNVTNT